LVTDPLQFKRALEHGPHFFEEVLAYDPLKVDLETEAKKVKAKELETKKQNNKKDKMNKINSQMSAYDKAMEEFMGFRM